MFLRIFCGADDRLEKDDPHVDQPIIPKLREVWLKDLERKGVFLKDGTHYSWKDLYIYTMEDDEM